MQKILIADSSYELCKELSRSLDRDYHVTYCHDSDAVVRLVKSLDPDILVLDLALPGADGIMLLQLLRSSGRNLQVLALTYNTTDSVIKALADLKVSYICQKPCSMDALASAVRMVAAQAENTLWIPETEVDNILLMLGFKMGLVRYEILRTAIMLKFSGEDGGITKCLYPAVAALFGGNAQQVEKAIRDAIHHAFKVGNKNNWNLYFALAEDERCPSNEIFIARVACALKARKRIQQAEQMLYLMTANG